MDLWARIKGKDYPITTGANFADELSETLDSGNIRLTHIHELIDIKPYDDVIIHDGTYTGRSYDEGYTGSGFYKHMICFSPIREQLSVDEADLSDELVNDSDSTYKSWYFNYNISLVSETKGLEKVPLPNRTITQPLRTEETTVNAKTLYDVAKEMIDLYSPYIKYSSDGNEWVNKRKYHFYEGTDVTHLGYKTIQLLKSKSCPEMSFQLPNLREVLNRIFNVVDALPIVKDGIICYRSLSKRNNKFSVWVKDSSGNLVPSKKGWGRDVWQMDGGSYTDRLIREHSNSLSKYSITHMVEDLGFKNSDSGKLTLDNMRLELTYPIYDIRKVYMCYWKTKGNDTTTVFKVKQDITKLVLRAEQRQLLSEDWTKYSYTSCDNEEELRKFKYTTIGYYQFSKNIGGWGERYTYLDHSLFANFRYTNTVIENIFNFYNRVSPYGTIDISKLMTPLDDGKVKIDFVTGDIYKVFNDIPTYIDETAPGGSVTRKITDKDGPISKYIYDSSDLSSNNLTKWFSDFTLFLKTVFFEVEYDGVISSSVVVSKSEHDGPIVTRDNPSNSLAFVENDGANEREKVDRLGNASLVLEQVALKPSELQEIGDYRTDDALVDGEEPLHKDEVVYRKSFTVFKDHVDAQYNLCKDYVLRNYFTSVYAKLRPFSYTSREESVERKENKTVQVFLSLNHSYYQTLDSLKSVYIKDKNEFLSKVLSFYKETTYNNYGTVIKNEENNCAYMYIPYDESYGDKEGKYWGLFQCDFQKYGTGNTLCFNIVMQDSISAGVYMSRFAPNFGSYVSNTLFTTIDTEKNLDLLSSSLQEWYILPSNEDTGYIDEMQFGIGRLENDTDTYVSTKVATYKSVLAPQIWSSSVDLGEKFYDRSIGVRYYEGDTWNNTANDTEVNKYGSSLSTFMKAKFGDNYNVKKDGSERLNVTLETEFIADNNIFISNNMVLLSDAYGLVEKRYSDYAFSLDILKSMSFSQNWAVWRMFKDGGYSGWGENLAFIPTLDISMPPSYKTSMKTIDFTTYDNVPSFTWTNASGKTLLVNITKIEWVPIRVAMREIYGVDVNTYPDNEAWPAPKITMYVVYEGVYTELVSKFCPVVPSDSSFYPVLNLRNANNPTWTDTIDGAYIDIMEGLGTTYTYENISDSLRAKLFKSGTNYQSGDNMINCTIMFPIFAILKQFYKSGGTSNYVTDYYFDKANQPTLAFKNLTSSFVDLNTQGIIPTKMAYFQLETDSTGSEYWKQDTSKTVEVGYSSKIITLCAGDSEDLLKSKNMQWRRSYRQLTEEDIYTEYDNGDGIGNPITLASSKLGQCLTLVFSGGSVPANGSVSLFYFEDNKWKFVFGVNNIENKDVSVINIYVSLVENREKTVYDSNMDPTYKINDYSKEKITQYGYGNFVSGGAGGTAPDDTYHTYKYVDGNGAVLASGEYKGDTPPEYTGTTPTKDEDDAYTYTFSKWGQTTDDLGNVTFTAIFEATRKSATGDIDYGDGDNTDLKTYVFKDSNNNVYMSGTFNPTEGEPDASIYKGETPTKDGYKFTGWTKTYDSDGNIIFYAQFSETVTVIWKNDDSSVLATETQYIVGDTPSYPNSTNPVSTKDSSATFSGWSPTISKITSVGTYVYIAQYQWETTVSTWTSLEQIRTLVGNPTSGTISFVDATGSDDSPALASKNSLSTDSLIGWSEYGVSEVTNDNGEDWFTGYLFNKELTKVTWNLTSATLTLEKFGTTPYAKAYSNQTYVSTSQTVPWNYYGSSVTVLEWMAGTTVGTKAVPYKYYWYYNANTDTEYTYQYTGSTNFAKDASKETSWKQITSEPTAIYDSDSCSIPETEWGNVYVKGFKVTHIE